MLSKLITFCAIVAITAPSTQAAESQRSHVVLIVWDGMRPDFLSETNTPTLFQLARTGVTFAHHHSTYPSATEVNGTAISTGAYPSHSGLMANSEYRPEIDPLKSIHTEALAAVRRGDELTHGHYLRRQTIAEIVRQADRATAIAGAKAVALLPDRSSRPADASFVNVFGGLTLPPNLLQKLTNRFGAFPAEKDNHPNRVDWTTDVLLDPLWANDVPEFSMVWMNEPDFTQHQTGPGSPQSLAAMRSADTNLARILQTLDAKGLRSKTDILVVSDHGCSTVATRLDLAEALQKAGLRASRQFQSQPSRGEILIVSNSGSTLVYVIGHQDELIRKVVHFLQAWPFTGVIFTRNGLPGTFPLSQVHLDTEAAPDIVVSMHWTAEKNQFGATGMLDCDLTAFTPGQGAHVSLSPFDMHATLVAAGPHFRSGIVSTLPSGNVDIAPTILWLLGLKAPKSMDGRILTEALTIKGPLIKSFEPRHLETKVQLGDLTWRQYLNCTEVNGVMYYDEGNGGVSSGGSRGK